MQSTAHVRIQWLHEELLRRTFPNAVNLSERFRISQRQAQRDIRFLKVKLGAPLAYDRRRQGYLYSAPFTLPVAMTTDNDSTYTRVADSPFGASTTELPDADNVIIQSQIPYTALLSITDKLTVLEMRSYIISEEGGDRYLCEFHNTDRFLCAVLIARAGIRILEPSWLRDRLIHIADKALVNNR